MKDNETTEMLLIDIKFKKFYSLESSNLKISKKDLRKTKKASVRDTLWSEGVDGRR